MPFLAISKIASEPTGAITEVAYAFIIVAVYGIITLALLVPVVSVVPIDNKNVMLDIPTPDVPLVPDVPTPDVPELPLDPEIPEDPLEPELPLVPDVPEDPSFPDEPELPDVPLVPDEPVPVPPENITPLT